MNTLVGTNMGSLVETVATTFSLSVFFIILLIFLYNLYSIKKNGFYVYKWCWYCSTRTTVLHSERKNFQCPCCLKYNAFQDGRSEQYVFGINKFFSNVDTESMSNGLCSNCNNNQHLKKHHLDIFTAEDDYNYVEELEHFRQQLEKKYKLCMKCENLFKVTVGKRLKSIVNHGLNLINLTKSSHGYSKEIKQSFCIMSSKCLLVLITILMICQIFNVKIDYPTPEVYLKKYSREAFASSSCYIPGNLSVKSRSTALMSWVGILLQIIVMFEKRSKMLKLKELFAWCLLVITSTFATEREFGVFREFLRVSSSFMLLYSYLASKTLTDNTGKISTKRKLRSPLQMFEDEISDDEDDVIECYNFCNSNPTSTAEEFFRNKRSINDLTNSFKRLSIGKFDDSLDGWTLKNISPHPYTVSSFLASAYSPVTSPAFNDFGRLSSQNSGYVSTPHSLNGENGGAGSVITEQSKFHSNTIDAHNQFTHQQLNDETDNNTVYYIKHVHIEPPNSVPPRPRLESPRMSSGCLPPLEVDGFGSLLRLMALEKQQHQNLNTGFIGSNAFVNSCFTNSYDMTPSQFIQKPISGWFKHISDVGVTHHQRFHEMKQALSPLMAY